MGLAVVALGGNIGDIHSTFIQARNDLAALPGSRLLESSLIYKTKAVGPPQPCYLNAALMLAADMEPLTLLRRMQDIEIHYGRVRGKRWGPRTLDLDLITFNTIRMNSNRLTLPHPRMHERIFVLQCMCEIWPDWLHPHLGKSVRELLGNLMIDGEPLLTKGMPWPPA